MPWGRLSGPQSRIRRGVRGDPIHYFLVRLLEPRARERADPKPGSPEEAEQAAQLQASCKAAVGHLFNIDGHAACGPSCTAKAGNAAYDPKHIPKKLKKYLNPGPKQVDL